MSKVFKGIPYGISNFKQLRNEGLYYVDKTMYIEKLEQAGHFLFFIRPRRFGKSLILNMLAAYYDMAEQSRFDTLFDGLYVKDYPTQEKGRGSRSWSISARHTTMPRQYAASSRGNVARPKGTLAKARMCRDL